MTFVLYSLTRRRTVAKSHGERSLPLMAKLFLRIDEQNKKYASITQPRTWKRTCAVVTMSHERNKNTRKTKTKLILNERFATCRICERWDDTQRVPEIQSNDPTSTLIFKPCLMTTLKNWNTLRCNRKMAYQVVDRIVPFFEERSTVSCI